MSQITYSNRNNIYNMNQIISSNIYNMNQIISSNRNYSNYPNENFLFIVYEF